MPTPLSTYLHVSNGGISFSVSNETEEGPCITIRSSMFGNVAQTTTVFTTTEGLAALAEMFSAASKLPFNEPYIHAARLMGQRRDPLTRA